MPLTASVNTVLLWAYLLLDTIEFLEPRDCPLDFETFYIACTQLRIGILIHLISIYMEATVRG